MTKPYWSDDAVTLHLGDCLEVLAGMEAASVDAIVTDPPAAVSFMGREWDSDMGGRAQWVAWLSERMAQAVRVLRPGGHALVWSLPRTAHWTAWALEDAGLEIRDCIPHLFGSGFPKSLDVSKAIDKLGRRDYVLAAIDLGLNVPGNNLHDWTKAEHSPGDEWWERFKAHLAVEDWQRIERKVTGRRRVRAGVAFTSDGPTELDVTAPATEDAARWNGWGTALKPGQELWWLARKPIRGTVAANVLEHGTGALNIAGCRVGTARAVPASNSSRKTASVYGSFAAGGGPDNLNPDMGRWPPNLVLTHSAACDARCAGDCPVAELDRQSGALTSGLYQPHHADNGKAPGTYGEMKGRERAAPTYGDSGGASRFYPVFRYQAKAPTAERPRLEDGTAHPTVKPLGLMCWLARLITPPGGTILDLFAGSGVTAEAAIIEGFRCILIERDPASAELIRIRLRKDIQPSMFA